MHIVSSQTVKGPGPERLGSAQLMKHFLMQALHPCIQHSQYFLLTHLANLSSALGHSTPE